MRTIHGFMPVVLSLAIAACGTTEPTTSNESGVEGDASSEPAVAEKSAELRTADTKPTSTYYAVRRDLRRCMSPMCGGYWVKAVNRAHTECADGRRAEECYVAEINVAADVHVEEGDLVHGDLLPRHYAGPDLTLAVLSADFALEPVLDDVVSRGHHFLVFDKGLRCIKAPCPTTEIAALNTPYTYGDHAVVFADRALEQPFHDEYGGPSSAGNGAISFGSFRYAFDWGTRRFERKLFIDNVYVVKAYEGPVCLVLDQDNATWAWNMRSTEEAEAMAADFTGYRIEHGTCDSVQTICPFVWAPVCGTLQTAEGATTETYGNACQMRGAVIEAAGFDSKATGSFELGACGDEI